VLTALPDPARTRTDLRLFFAGTFAASWAPWGAALLAGGDLAQPVPHVLFVVGTFGPSAVAALLWLAGRRRPRERGSIRSAHRWFLPALLLGAAPAVAAAVVDGSFDLAAAGARVAAAGAHGRRARLTSADRHAPRTRFACSAAPARGAGLSRRPLAPSRGSGPWRPGWRTAGWGRRR
jgi:hypothetical protein